MEIWFFEILCYGCYRNWFWGHSPCESKGHCASENVGAPYGGKFCLRSSPRPVCTLHDIWDKLNQNIFCCILTDKSYKAFMHCLNTHWSKLSFRPNIPPISRTYIFWCAMTHTFTWAMPPKSNPVLPIT